MPTTADTSSYNQPPPQNALGVANDALGLANNAQQLKAGQFDLINKQYGVLHNILGSLASDDNLTVSKVMGGITHAAQLGLITPQIAATESSSVNQIGENPAKLKALATSHLVQSMSGAEQFANQYGSQVVDQGPTQSFQRINRLTGQVTPMSGGTFNSGLSPADATAATKIGTDAQGRDVYGTKRQFIQRAGGGNALFDGPQGVGYTPGMAPPAGPGVAMPNALGVQPPAPPPPPPSHSAAPSSAPVAIAAAAPPAASRNAATPSAAAPVARPAAPTEGIALGLPPGAAEAAAKGLGAGAEQGAALQAAADAAPTRKGTLANLEKDLGSFTSGPGADRVRTVKAGVNAVSGMAGGPAIFDPKSIASQENFTKLAQQLAQQQSLLLGGTDAALASAGHSNPNTDFSNLGNQRVIQILKGNEDAIAAKSSAWQQFKKINGPGADYGTFQTGFNQNYEPRAFQFPYMSPTERTDMFKSMTPNERAQIQGAIEQAVRNGYIKPPARGQ